MHETSKEEWQRVLIRGSIIGFAGSFLVVLAICLLVGVSLLNSAGCAILPGVQGSWFYGGTIYLLRADLVEEKRRKKEKAGVPRTAVPVEPPLKAAA